MASKAKETGEDLAAVVDGLVAEYKKVKNLYDAAGIEAGLKEQALQGMVNMIQLTQVAIQNYANWKHVLREDKKCNK